MTAWVDRFAATWLDASFAAAWLLGLAALAMLACRQPVRRVALARAALLGSLALIPLVVAAPLPRVALPGLLRDPRLRVHPLLSGAGPSPAATLIVDRGLPKDRIGLRPDWATFAGVPARLLVLGYLVGVGGGLGGVVLGYWGMGWLTRRSIPPSAETVALYRSLPGEGRRPRLAVSARVRRPVLVGLLRPTILIPAELERPDAAGKLRLSLLHELAHAEVGDPWFGLVSGLAQSCWFFLPPLWWIRRQMRLDQEFLADRRAAGSYGPLPIYASSLLDLAGPSRSGGRGGTAAGPVSGGRCSALFQRVLMLVQCPFAVESHPPRWWVCWLPGVVAATTLAASCLTLQASGTADSSPPEPSSPSSPRTFRMARLVVKPASPGVPGQSALFELPMRLPERFELTVEVLGDHEALVHTRVIGRRLARPGAPAGPDDAAEAWHPVRIRRDGAGLRLWIDQKPLPVAASSWTTAWLSVESTLPGPRHFRNLTLTW